MIEAVPTLRDRLAAKRRAERGTRDLLALLPTAPPKIDRAPIPEPHPNRVGFRLPTSRSAMHQAKMAIREGRKGADDGD